MGVVSKSVGPYMNNTGSVGEYGGNGNKESMNVVVVVLDVRNGGRKFFAKEVRVEKGSENVQASAVKTGRKLCGFLK